MSPSAAPGGAERALASLARRLPEFGWNPTVLLLESGPFEGWLEDLDCRVEVMAMTRTRHLHRTIPMLNRLRRRCRLADVVVSNQSKGHAIGGLASAAAGVPSVWWQQGIPGRSLIEVVAAAVPSAAVVCSATDAFQAQLRLTPRRRVELINLGIDTALVRRGFGGGAALRTRHGWDDKQVVGIVARLQPWKGQELFLQAAALVGRARPDVRFAVVGGAVLGWEGDYPSRLRDLATRLGLGDRVVFAGHQDDAYTWFDAFDVAVTASVGEPFGLVTVEALASGTPLVGVRSGGTAEIVEDGVSGLLVAPGGAQAMADAILGILADPALSARLVQAGYARAETFTDTAMASRFATLLEQVAKRGG